MTPNFAADARLRAIALNSVREAMLVYGRWDRPFTDDDAARVDNIYQILHLAERQTEYEHAALASAEKPSVDDQVQQIANLLAKLPASPEPSNSVLEDTAVKASLPKSVAARKAQQEVE